jgi:hypothetical protein
MHGRPRLRYECVELKEAGLHRMDITVLPPRRLGVTAELRPTRSPNSCRLQAGRRGAVVTPRTAWRRAGGEQTTRRGGSGTLCVSAQAAPSAHGSRIGV